MICENFRFSIIVPLYRVEKYINMCIKSVLSQSYSNYEMIIIDDGSDDDSYFLAKHLSQNNSNVQIYRKENGGLASARNYGLHFAIGEYVLFLDSDDYFQTDFLSDLNYMLNALTPDVLFFNGFKEFDKQLKPVRKIIQRNNVMSGMQFMDHCIAEHEWISVVWLGAYKRSFLEKYNINFIEGYIHEDDTFLMKTLLYAKSVAYIDKKWYHYRIRSSSIMKSKKAIHDFYGFREAARYAIQNLKHQNSEGLRWLAGRYLLSCVKYLYRLPLDLQEVEYNSVAVLWKVLQDYLQQPYKGKLQALLNKNGDYASEAYQIWYDYIKEYFT